MHIPSSVAVILALVSCVAADQSDEISELKRAPMRFGKRMVAVSDQMAREQRAPMRYLYATLVFSIQYI